MAYIPVKKQCWLRTCPNEACVTVLIKGVRHKVCTTHAVTYRTSYERELRKQQLRDQKED